MAEMVRVNTFSEPPRKRRFGCCKFIFLLMLIIVILMGIYGYGQYQNYTNFSQYKNAESSSATVEFEIKKGESFDSIVTRLIAEKLILDTQVATFPAYKLFIAEKAIDTTKIQAGFYEIPLNASAEQIFSLLQNQECGEVQITIREGLRIEEIADDIQKGFTGKTRVAYNKEEFISLAKNFSNPDKIQVGYTIPVNLEGYLFPDTYHFCQDVKTKDIINTLLKNFDKKINQALQNDFKKSKITFAEVINLASIVEREARTYETKQMISDIFLRRLSYKMPLGSDVTTMYGYGYSDVQKTWWRHGYELDLVINDDHPYSTRTRTGLPPTPISNPGLETIKSVLNPIPNNYLFFLVGNDNKMYYGRNLNEHNYNVCKYLRNQCK